MPPILEAVELCKSYPMRGPRAGRGDRLAALDGVTIKVGRGETLAVVGESGAGKSTLGRAILRLIEVDSGTIRFDGADLVGMSKRELRRQRARMQMIFQDPYSSLDLKMVVGDSVGEPLLLHERAGKAERRERVKELLQRVGIRPDQINLYPYELSGGQLQRVAIARAIATSPALLVCDEPVASLDVSIRNQVMNLLRDLQGDSGMAYVFVSHDLSLVGTIADRIAVMYAGRVVETGRVEAIFEAPAHPYTQRLLSAIPSVDPRRRRLTADATSNGNDDAQATWQGGCAFAHECPRAMSLCRVETPTLRVVAGGMETACHLYDEGGDGGEGGSPAGESVAYPASAVGVDGRVEA